VPSRPPAALNAARGGKIAEVLLRSLPASGDALVFARDRYLASLSSSNDGRDFAAAPKPTVPERDAGGAARTFDLLALRRRLETAATRTTDRAAGAGRRDAR
jgi:hypothetical protein